MMVSEGYIFTHPLLVRHKNQLKHELKFSGINIDNIDELAIKGINLVLNVDRAKSWRALSYIRFYSNVDMETMLRVFVGKELSQIIFDISDREDSIIDYFGWVTLAVIFGVKI
jgi:hypothetical protein